MAKEFTYEVKKHLGIISETDNMTVELNVISYNGSEAKYDLRRWRIKGEDRTMQKGICLNLEELATLRDLLNGMEELK